MNSIGKIKSFSYSFFTFTLTYQTYYFSESQSLLLSINTQDYMFKMLNYKKMIKETIIVFANYLNYLVTIIYLLEINSSNVFFIF